MIPWSHCRQLCTLAYLFLTSRIVVEALDLTDAQIDVVSLRLTESAKLSWELGTRAETILERNATNYSVFSRKSLPPPSNPDASTLSALKPFFDIANTVVSQPRNQTSPQGFMPQDASAADSASLGVCVLIANWTRAANGGESRGLDYAGAAKSQIDFLFSAVPRTQDGALSHRVSELQLWSDSVYMVPPFLAYYGVTTRNRTMVREAYNQIKLYRSYLLDPHQGMWKHISLGSDSGFWSTGNGWAAAGMLRVYTTIQKSEYAPSLKSEMRDIANWVQEIHKGMYDRLDSTSIFANYAERPANSTGNFYDAASTALLASTVYRAAQFLGQHGYLSYAEKSRQALSATNPNPNSNSSSTSSLFPSYAHFTTDGVLFPVVDPYSVGRRGATVSPEGQAFVIQMHQAWKDWKAKSGGKRCVALVGSRGSILVVFVIWSTFVFV